MHRDYESHRYPDAQQSQPAPRTRRNPIARIAILLVVLAGWYVWKSNQSASEPEPPASSPAAQTASDAADAQSADAQSADAQSADAQSADAPSASDAGPKAQAGPTAAPLSKNDADKTTESKTAGSSSATASERGGATPRDTGARAPRSGGTSPANASSKSPRPTPLGRLTDLPGNKMRSTAGLIYGPGSREGHRLKHVMKHSRNEPNRPGYHGVFDGDQDKILAVIDEAFLRSQRGEGKKQVERQRTVLTVDMKRKVGFVGGKEGGRRGNPPAHFVRLVLEDRDVITAFPLKP